MKLSKVLLLSTLLVAQGVFAETSQFSLLSAEGFGSVGIQSIQSGGKSYAGGFHYTPSYRFSDLISAKAFLGIQLFKSTPTTGSKVYVVGDYIGAAHFDVCQPVAVNAGFGGGTDFRSDGKTRPAALLGLEYKFQNGKLLDLFDRAILNGHYYFNSSDLWVIHYGLGIAL